MEDLPRADANETEAIRKELYACGEHIAHLQQQLILHKELLRRATVGLGIVYRISHSTMQEIDLDTDISQSPIPHPR